MMKIYIPESGSLRGGKDFFFDRLSQALRGLGENVMRNPSKPHDISLQSVFIKKTNAKRHVLRLDGVHHNIDTDYKKVNQSIIVKGVSKADAIVYQSQFSKTICEKYLGVFEGKTSIISNGAHLKPQRETPKNSIVFTASRWRPHKRLVDIIESFLLADIYDSLLYIAGDLKDSGIKAPKIKEYSQNSKIVFLGAVSQEIMEVFFGKANVFMHLCWFDNCPNGVVEALSYGIPVITNNVGGTCEIVKPSGGIVLPLDKTYDFEPCHLYKPPKIDQCLVAAILKRCLKPDFRFEIHNEHIDIRNIAKQYRNFFVEVLNG